MPSSLLTDRVMESMTAVRVCYHRLVTVVGQGRTGKTAALHEVRDVRNALLLNISFELSKRLLDLTERQRSLQIPRLMDEIVSEGGHDEVLLDNNEILFDVRLKQDPLRIFEGLSRSRPVVVAWNGRATSENLIYAAPGHPEFRQYPLRDITVVLAEDAMQSHQVREQNR